MKRKLVLTKEPGGQDDIWDDWRINSIGMELAASAYVLADNISRGQTKLTVLVSDEPDKLDADLTFNKKTDLEYSNETIYTTSGRMPPTSHYGEILFCNEGLKLVFTKVPKTFYLQIVHNEAV